MEPVKDMHGNKIKIGDTVQTATGKSFVVAGISHKGALASSVTIVEKGRKSTEDGDNIVWGT